MTELFSIKNNETSSLGARVVLSHHLLASDSPEQKVIPEIAFTYRKDVGISVIGVFIWRGGTMGDLWKIQTETYQFILDNVDKIV